MHKSMLRTSSFAFLILLSGTLAHAERKNPLAGQPAIRNRLEMRKLRFEASPQFTASTNQDYKTAIGFGGKLQFHIFDWIGVGFEGSYLFDVNTSLENKVRGKLQNRAAGDYVPGTDGPAPFRSIHDQHVLDINGIMSAFVAVTPFSGKFSLFSALFMNYDLFFTGGIGMVNYVQNGCCTLKSTADQSAADPRNSGVPDPNTQDGSQYAGLKVGGAFSVGAHLYFNDWVGIMLELRDYLVKANPGGLDVNGDRRLNGDDETVQNNLFVNVGVTFMLPPKAKITH